jgi:adenylate cyclase class 2
MPPDYEETEVKFYLRDPAQLANQILAAGGRLHIPRTHEFNLRFDTPDREFQRAHRVLRLRRDQTNRLTYKEGGRIQDGALRRMEIEFDVGDFDAARQMLEALGFEVVFAYEKYRTTYELKGTQIMLDELPFGDFVEIEGPPELLRPVAITLKLDWQAAIPYSYHDLFERLRAARTLPFRDLTFENFSKAKPQADDLGVRGADR